MHSGLFGCLTKLGAKRAELVQKVVPQSRVRIFRNERIRSTPLDPKLTFWCISYYSGAFMAAWLLTKLGAKRAELVQNFVTQSCVGTFRNELTYSTPLDPKLIFWGILYYSGVFRTIVCLMKLSAKWAELVQKVHFHEVASKFFATNAPDLPHCIQKSCFGAFCTIWVHLG